MNLKVAVEQLDDGSFQASTTYPLALSSAGPTKESVLESLRQMARERMANCELLDLQIDVSSSGEHPWMKFAGIWQNNEMFEDYVESVEEYRLAANER